MSCAMRKPSRLSPSRKSPAIASRGAKPMACTKPSNCGQWADRSRTALDLLVAAHVAIKDQLRAEVGGELGDAVLEALAHIAEGQLRALGVAGLGNAIGDRAVGQHAGDQQFFAGQESHKSLGLKNLCRIVACANCWPGCCWAHVSGASPRCGRRTAMRCGAISSTRRASPTSDYVNPAAPKGGELRLVSNLRVSTFDKYNPFTIKGCAGLPVGLMFDSLLAGSLDETGAGYGLLAEDVEVAPTACRPPSAAPGGAFPQRRPGAGRRRQAQLRHADGAATPRPPTRPRWKMWRGWTCWTSARCATASSANRELPLTVGGLPVFSRKWGMETARPSALTRWSWISRSAAARTGSARSLRQGHHLCARPELLGARPQRARGTSNFDRITVKIYKDNTARLEALKAGEFDLMRFFSAGDWARRVNGKRFRHRRTGQGRVQAPAAVGLPELCAQHPPAKLRTSGCARPWGWPWTTSG
jgi:hypothetical protein